MRIYNANSSVTLLSTKISTKKFYAALYFALLLQKDMVYIKTIILEITRHGSATLLICTTTNLYKRIGNLRSSFGVCLFLLCFLPPAIASNDQQNNLRAYSLEQLLNVKVAIASRTDVSLKKSPSSVSLFTRNDIQALGVRTLTELFSYVPGFYSMMNSVEGNQSHLVMRGHAQKYANTLLVLLNGQRINDDYIPAVLIT